MKDIPPRTCVSPLGRFVYGIHKPQYTVTNLREKDHLVRLGHVNGKKEVDNRINFPLDDMAVNDADWVFEVANPFPFMGATYLLKSSADRRAGNANPFRSDHGPADASQGYEKAVKEAGDNDPLLISLGRTSTDPNLLVELAKKSCSLEFNPDTKAPVGIEYEESDGPMPRPHITNRHLFEIVSNNPSLPDAYKQAMVLLPGIQGGNRIVGEYERPPKTHIWEYLRNNSYIPWGHYAANMAHDAIRYRIGALDQRDMTGLRHLYYQRIYTQLAGGMNIPLPARRRTLTEEELESMRKSLLEAVKVRLDKKDTRILFNATLWGWNFGFDLSPSGYRLNASHQQIHQQFALIPPLVPAFENGENNESSMHLPTYIQGDDVALFCRRYKEQTGKDFFDAYIAAIQNNERMDGLKEKNKSLIFYEDENVMAFVPKAQRSQGEVQIMTKAKCGNILETGIRVRRSIDRAILVLMRTLEGLGVEMMAACEISKRFDNPDTDQRLLYIFLPRHAQSPGTLSEQQNRWIIGQYPEDFAHSCQKEVGRLTIFEDTSK
jgi:hypothetical protein